MGDGKRRAEGLTGGGNRLDVGQDGSGLGWGGSGQSQGVQNTRSEAPVEKTKGFNGFSGTSARF